MDFATTESNKNKDFFKAVYQVVALIPKGRFTTYGAIASYLGNPRGARIVGWALNGSRKHNIPAHRVLNKQGQLTGKQFFDSPESMMRTLEMEGVQIKNNRVVKFDEYFWDPIKELSI